MFYNLWGRSVHMFSVTKRIANVQQPRLGYIPVKTLTEKKYHDDFEIKPIDSFQKTIQGMAVDYLTRFMLGTPKMTAFEISIKGATLVNELDNALGLLNQITGLDIKSICAACQLVGYDVAFRRGPKFFTPIDAIMPTNDLIKNIVILVNRCISFFEKNGPVVLTGFDFQGGYNNIISSGDGDYLTADTLWDLKISKFKPNSKQTLQILVYYILGFHSVHVEFQSIKKIGLFNPELNASYDIQLSDISNDVFQAVSYDVIGYCIPKDSTQWQKANGTSKIILKKANLSYSNIAKDTGFSPDNYDNGIYDISVDDYWSYYRRLSDTPKPSFSRTSSVKFIKNNGFIMFVSISQNGTPSVLHGGFLRHLDFPLEYYYERLPEYANTVLRNFSKYWETLYCISDQLKSFALNNVECRKRFMLDKGCNDDQSHSAHLYELWYRKIGNCYQLPGKVHGCIVDIDFFNHIFLNPYDGTISPYHALSTSKKYVYKNVCSLLVAQKPNMLPEFYQKAKSDSDTSISHYALANSNESTALSIFNDQEIDTACVEVSDTSMYYISNRMKMLQFIYDYHLIVVWYDDVLPHHELPAKRNRIRELEIGECKVMRCGLSATVLSDDGYDKVTVQFEDGTIVKNCKRKDYLDGVIANTPSKKVAPKEKTSYIGRSAIMKCGLKATVIEDYGYKNITVQFEDGLVKKNCRRDKFLEGKLGHKP